MNYFKRIIAFCIAVIMAACMMTTPFTSVKASDKEYGDENNQIDIYIRNGVATSEQSNQGWSFANNTVTLQHGYTFNVYAFDEGVDITVDNHGVLYDVNYYITKLINESDGICDETCLIADIENYGKMVECSIQKDSEGVQRHLNNHSSISSCYVHSPTTNYAGGFIDQDVWFYDGIEVQGNAGIIRVGIDEEETTTGIADHYIDVTTGSKISEPALGNDNYLAESWYDDRHYVEPVDFTTLEVRNPYHLRANTRKKVWVSNSGSNMIDASNLTRSFHGAVYPYVTGDTNVVWTVEGAENPATTIDAKGNLTVSPEETAAKIKVRATSVNQPSLSYAEELEICLPRITTAEVLPTAAVNEPYHLKLEFSGDASNYTMTSQYSHLPEGLTLDADGTLHGTLTKTGTYNVFTAGYVTYNAGKYNEKTQNISGTFTLAVKENQSLDTSSFNDVSKYTFAQSFTQTVTGPKDGGAITYSSSDEKVAKVDSTTGEVTVAGEGTATITANAAETDEYLLASASYKVTVDRAPTPNTSTGVLNGDNQTLNTKELPTEGMTVRYDMPMKEVVKVTLDNKELTLNKDFTMWSGSTFIKLTPAFLATLPEGEHTLAIFSDHDYKSSNFTLTAPAVEPKKEDTGRGDVITPKTSTDVANTESVSNTTTPKTSTAVNTGDQTNVLLYTVLLLLSVAAVIGVRKIYKKNI